MERERGGREEREGEEGGGRRKGLEEGGRVGGKKEIETSEN